MPATRQESAAQPINGAGETGQRRTTATESESQQIKSRGCNQNANKRAEEKGIKDASQAACGPIRAARQADSARSQSGLPEHKGASSASSVAGSASGAALRQPKAPGTPSPAGIAGADSDLVNVANENRVILNVGGIRHETYKVSLIGAKPVCVRLARWPAGKLARSLACSLSHLVCWLASDESSNKDSRYASRELLSAGRGRDERLVASRAPAYLSSGRDPGLVKLLNANK